MTPGAAMPHRFRLDPLTAGLLPLATTMAGVFSATAVDLIWKPLVGLLIGLAGFWVTLKLRKRAEESFLGDLRAEMVAFRETTAERENIIDENVARLQKTVDGIIMPLVTMIPGNMLKVEATAQKILDHEAKCPTLKDREEETP